tara:strand:+ start:41 stop:892 length:852 start_codon:yes stop_codon:yes gene_type:complete
MAVQSFTAYSIGRPLLESLEKKPFTGYVAGIYKHSCNIIGDDGRMITLALPSIGNGPFSILIEVQTPLASITPKMRVRAGHYDLTVGNILFIHLEGIDYWVPRLLQFPRSFHLKTLNAKLLNDYTQWLEPLNKISTSKIVKDKLIARALELQQALSNGNSIKRSVINLAGLGFGLTPSGDDYLLGVMASLWVTRNTSGLKEIAQLACKKTTFLSAAFLKAASKGEFAECWHRLALAILSQETKPVQEAISEFVQIGAYSGRDALSGFTTHFLDSRFGVEMSQS